MMDFSTLSTKKKAAINCGMLLLAFLIGGLIGYVRGTFGDDGSTERAMEWAIKTSFLGIWLIVVSAIFGRVATFLEFNLKLPFIASLAITAVCITNWYKNEINCRVGIAHPTLNISQFFLSQTEVQTAV